MPRQKTPTTGHKDYQKLLDKFLEGKCSPDELEFLEQWSQSLDDQDEGNATLHASPAELLALKEEMRRNIAARIDENEAPNKTARGQRPGPRKTKVTGAHR